MISVTTQPQGADLTVGDALSLTVAATISDGVTPTYQWNKGGAAIAGATDATYGIPVVATTDAGSFTAVVSGSTADPVTSSPAVVTVAAAGGGGAESVKK